MPATPERDFSFRCATVADIERIRAHVHAAYRGDSSRVGWTTEADLLDGQRTDVRELKELIESQDTQLWLMHRGDDLLATISLKRESSGVVYLGMIAVRPDQQTQGIGRALMEKTEQLVREQALGSRLEMTVIGQRKELIAWYERRGFRVTDEQRPFPYGDPRFGLPRRPDLYFIVMVKAL